MSEHLKLFIWRLFLRKGWYQITWNSGAFDIKDRAYWDGRYFKHPHGLCDIEAMSIFVKRISK